MKSMKTLLTASLLSLSVVMAAAENPVAPQSATVTAGNARFTVLTPEMIRVEYSPAGKFEDNATFAIINRELPVPQFKTTDDGTTLTITTDNLNLRYVKGTDPRTNPASADNLSITMELNGNPVTWYPGLDDPQNLRGTYRTLDRNNADEYRDRLEQGVISRSGWAVIDDSPAATRADGSRSLAFVKDPDGIDWVAPRADEDALDIYFMGYGHDYKKAIYDFTRIAGKIPLPPDYVLGYWYSKYDNYTADDFRNIIKSMADNDINADVLILDMDWHWNGEKEVSGGRGGWTGWSWNTNLIPDPDGLLNDIHKSGLRAALNLHPADGVDSSEDQYTAVCADLNIDPATGKRIPWQLEDKAFKKAFFKNIIRPLERQGVDFWWLDWQQKLTNDSIDGLGQTFWCNHVFFNDMKQARPDRRPVIFHRWGGLGSHRYQIGFSGDTFITFPTLAFEPYFTSTASNVGYAYWGHDLGGHMIEGRGDPNDAELLLRWMQFGVFTPIFRTHATKDPLIERRIWTYDNFDDLNATVKLRYAIFPYLYTMARKTYDTGIGMVRPMYYEYPELDEAYAREGQYYFGDDIIVSPVVTPATDGISRQEVWLPDGAWWSPAHAQLLKGNAVHTLDYTLQQIPYFMRQGSIIVNNPPEVKKVTERPGRLILNVIGGADGKGQLYEDSGDSNDYATVYATTDFTQTVKGRKTTVKIAPREGSYPGMPTQRAYELRYFGPKVNKAAVNGKKATVSYDPATACSTIAIPTLPCDKAITVDLENAK